MVILPAIDLMGGQCVRLRQGRADQRTVYNDDPVAPARVINDFAKKLGDRFNIKAAFMDGKILSAAEIEEIAALPSKDALYAKVLGTMLAPITSLAVCLGQILEQKGGSIESAEPAAEAAAE